MKPITCIDAGHNSYGEDTGAEAQGYKEQDLTLDICLRMKPLLIFNGITPVLTREGPTVKGSYNTLNQSLQTRYDISNNAKADIFVSVHINATPGGTGTEVLIYAKGGRAEDLAEAVLPELITVCNWANRGIKVRTNVGVLGPRVNAPSILTENGFIDSPSDILKLKDPSFRQALAVAHVKGICKYFGIEYKEEEIMKHAVIYFTDTDFSSARIISRKLGGCAMYCRDGVNANIHKDIENCEHPVIVGGAELNIPGATNCCGLHAEDTAIKAAQYAKTL